MLPDDWQLTEAVNDFLTRAGTTFALACTALGLGPFQTVAFVDSQVESFLSVDPDEEFAVYLLAAGVPAEPGSPLPADFDFPPPAQVR